MRDLTDAAVEGLVLCKGETIVSVNQSFARLANLAPEQICGRELAACLPNAKRREALFAVAGQAIEADLLDGDGTLIPVELITRQITYNGESHNVVAFRDLRDRRNAEAQIRYLAHHDPLTGLDNRASFDQRLNREIKLHRRTGQQLALLCLDLDRFKDVNDLYGHSAGDQLLQHVAQQFSSVLAEDHMLARLGGDEFAIIVPRPSDPAQAGQSAESLLKSLKGPDTDKTPAGVVSVSIGIALYPSDARDRTELLSTPTPLSIAPRAEGRGTYRFFEAAMGAQIRERRSSSTTCGMPSSDDELRLVYQPQAQVDTGEVVGFEALLRWTPSDARQRLARHLHPDRRGKRADPADRRMGPARRPAGRPRLDAAAERRRQRLGRAVARSDDFAELVARVLLRDRPAARAARTRNHRDGADPRSQTARWRLCARLKTLGVRIAMDDFGTGYSSLSNLQAFPFDKIKIDRSFIQAVHTKPQAAAIVRAVLGLGRGLGLPVLAEGVETAEELSFLGLEGCTEAQGYLVGHPAPIHELSSLICDNIVALPKPLLRAVAE